MLTMLRGNTFSLSNIGVTPKYQPGFRYRERNKVSRSYFMNVRSLAVQHTREPGKSADHSLTRGRAEGPGRKS